MRPEPNPRIEAARVGPSRGFPPSDAGANWGAFEIKAPTGALLRIISSGTPDADDPGAGWEHVSVSLPGRCPNWEEMAFVKSLFWDDEETVIQFHPKASAHVNRHRYCLHLWKRVGVEAELPPRQLVG